MNNTQQQNNQSSPIVSLIQKLESLNVDFTPAQDMGYAPRAANVEGLTKVRPDEWWSVANDVSFDHPGLYNYICYGIDEYEQENYNLYN